MSFSFLWTKPWHIVNVWFGTNDKHMNVDKPCVLTDELVVWIGKVRCSRIYERKGFFLFFAQTRKKTIGPDSSREIEVVCIFQKGCRCFYGLCFFVSPFSLSLSLSLFHSSCMYVVHPFTLSLSAVCVFGKYYDLFMPYYSLVQKSNLCVWVCCESTGIHPSILPSFRQSSNDHPFALHSLTHSHTHTLSLSSVSLSRRPYGPLIQPAWTLFPTFHSCDGSVVHLESCTVDILLILLVINITSIASRLFDVWGYNPSSYIAHIY